MTKKNKITIAILLGAALCVFAVIAVVSAKPVVRPGGPLGPAEVAEYAKQAPFEDCAFGCAFCTTVSPSEDNAAGVPYTPDDIIASGMIENVYSCTDDLRHFLERIKEYSGSGSFDFRTGRVLWESNAYFFTSFTVSRYGNEAKYTPVYDGNYVKAVEVNFGEGKDALLSFTADGEKITGIELTGCCGNQKAASKMEWIEVNNECCGLDVWFDGNVFIDVMSSGYNHSLLGMVLTPDSEGRFILESVSMSNIGGGIAYTVHTEGESFWEMNEAKAEVKCELNGEECTVMCYLNPEREASLYTRSWTCEFHEKHHDSQGREDYCLHYCFNNGNYTHGECMFYTGEETETVYVDGSGNPVSSEWYGTQVNNSAAEPVPTEEPEKPEPEESPEETAAEETPEMNYGGLEQYNVTSGGNPDLPYSPEGIADAGVIRDALGYGGAIQGMYDGFIKGESSGGLVYRDCRMDFVISDSKLISLKADFGKEKAALTFLYKNGCITGITADFGDGDVSNVKFYTKDTKITGTGFGGKQEAWNKNPEEGNYVWARKDNCAFAAIPGYDGIRLDFNCGRSNADDYYDNNSISMMMNLLAVPDCNGYCLGNIDIYCGGISTGDPYITEVRLVMEGEGAEKKFSPISGYIESKCFVNDMYSTVCYYPEYEQYVFSGSDLKYAYGPDGDYQYGYYYAQASKEGAGLIFVDADGYPINQGQN